MLPGKRPRYWLWVALFLFLVGAGVAIFSLLERNLLPTIAALAETKATQAAVERVNRAIREKIAAENLCYQDFVTVHKDNSGRVALLQADAVRVSALAADLAVTVEEALAQLQEEAFYIPLGQVLGSQLLASYGPRIEVRILPVGTVKIQVLDQLETAGINQTRHRLLLHLDAQVRVVVPLQQRDIRVAADVPLVEGIIVGTVPNTLLTGGGVISIPVEERR
ncbi:sporulation protein YunB [Ammonifex degensii KC4]|uniref:Sporulation protein YunB n=1 Tax=Ammonifex degensii (strain DSM 10501 / KC4) TaxID=429009 RepID=C9R907_AMMDK|nr:sporulation protein YunB [Ammonifex degensii]ACX52786.1 sporulation protein YunB [Ammonifex degensii KC4]